ncbi:hypothetical protein Tco_0829616 [Tanacetum coccineum]
MSNDVMSIVMNSVNPISNNSELHDNYTKAQARCSALESEVAKLQDKIFKDDHGELVKRFSKLEVEHLNLQMKYQGMKERFNTTISPSSSDTPEFDSVFKLNSLQEQILAKNNVISDLKEQLSRVKKRSREESCALNIETLDSKNRQLTQDLFALQEKLACFRAENEKVKQHYKELYDSIKITHAKTIEQKTALHAKIESLKAQLKEKMVSIPSDTVKPKVLAPGLYAIDVVPLPPPPALETIGKLI